MSDLTETQRRAAALRTAYESLPAAWPTHPIQCRSRMMLATIVALLSEQTNAKGG